MKEKYYWFLLVVIFGIGAILRFWQLGHDSLWNDEVGVAIASLSTNLSGVFEAIRSHTMAMPLDYIISWLFFQISLDEFIIRMPAAIFGIISLVVCFLLYTYLTNRTIALLATFLLAISTLHIQYSQELRFYASLIFFYHLTTLLLVIAIQNQRWIFWLIFSAITSMGIFFHIYVVLVVITGGIWIGADFLQHRLNRHLLLNYGASTAIILIIFTTGYLYFGIQQNLDLPLSPFGKSILKTTAQGLGWLEIGYSNHQNLGWIWYITCMVLAIIGIVTSMKLRQRYIIIMLLGSFIQIVVIISADVIKHYFFSSRQIMHLHPFAILLASIGIESIVESSEKSPLLIRASKYLSNVFHLDRKNLVRLIVATIMLITSIPALKNYYLWPKSIAREISQILINNWRPGEQICVMPGYSQKIFTYYLDSVYGFPEIATNIRPTSLNNLFNCIGTPKVYLIYIREGPINNKSQIDQIIANGFKPLLPPDRLSRLGQSIFYK